jgi:hypothetical protein
MLRVPSLLVALSEDSMKKNQKDKKYDTKGGCL